MAYKRISANWDHDDDMYIFRRKHSGDAPDPIKPPLTPVWPMIALGTFLLVLGGFSAMTAANAAVALGGAILAMIGLGLIAWFAYLLGGRDG